MNKLMIMCFLTLISFASAELDVIERFKNGQPRWTQQQVSSGKYDYEIDRMYDPNGRQCYYGKNTKIDGVLIAKEVHGQKPGSVENADMYSGSRWLHIGCDPDAVNLIMRFNANGDTIYYKEMTGDDSWLEKECKNRHCSYKEFRSGKLMCSSLIECNEIRKKEAAENEKEIEKYFQLKEKEDAEKQRRAELEERQAKIAFLAKYDIDNDGFCSGAGISESKLNQFCKGRDLCPQNAGTYGGCTEEQKIKIDYDKDHDKFCDNEKIYQKYSKIFIGLDLCPDEAGTAPDGCTEAFREKQLKEATQEIDLEILQRFDCDNDGVCSSIYDEKGPCAGYTYGEKSMSIDEYSYSDKYLPKDQIEKIIRDKKRKVCYAGLTDECPGKKGLPPLGCPDYETSNIVEEKFGDPDPDHDGFCSKWIGEKGLWQAMGKFCNRDHLDECPDVFGSHNGCPESNSLNNNNSGSYDSQGQRSSGLNGGSRQTFSCPERPDGCDKFQIRRFLEAEYGDPDPDRDGICSGWVQMSGYADAYSTRCKGVDECPDKWEANTPNGCPPNREYKNRSDGRNYTDQDEGWKTKKVGPFHIYYK